MAQFVIPAKAGIHTNVTSLDPCFRRDDNANWSVWVDYEFARGQRSSVCRMERCVRMKSPKLDKFEFMRRTMPVHKNTNQGVWNAYQTPWKIEILFVLKEI